MATIMNRLYLRIRYYWRALCVLVGLCPDCATRLNFTRSGRAHCPSCGKMK